MIRDYLLQESFIRQDSISVHALWKTTQTTGMDFSCPASSSAFWKNEIHGVEQNL